MRNENQNSKLNVRNKYRLGERNWLNFIKRKRNSINKRCTNQLKLLSKYERRWLIGCLSSRLSEKLSDKSLSHSVVTDSLWRTLMSCDSLTSSTTTVAFLKIVTSRCKTSDKDLTKLMQKKTYSQIYGRMTERRN